MNQRTECRDEEGKKENQGSCRNLDMSYSDCTGCSGVCATEIRGGVWIYYGSEGGRCEADEDLKFCLLTHNTPITHHCPLQLDSAFLS